MTNGRQPTHCCSGSTWASSRPGQIRSENEVHVGDAAARNVEVAGLLTRAEFELVVESWVEDARQERFRGTAVVHSALPDQHSPLRVIDDCSFTRIGGPGRRSLLVPDDGSDERRHEQGRDHRADDCDKVDPVLQDGAADLSGSGIYPRLRAWDRARPYLVGV